MTAPTHSRAMRLGDLDGLGVLYDKVGRPILGEGERLIAERRATLMALFEGKRAKGQPRLHHDQGDVLVVLTDRRLLLLVDPSLGRARDVLRLPGEESWTRGMEMFKVIQGRGRYYVELSWTELAKVKLPSQRRTAVTIPVMADGGVPHILQVDRETAAWIEQASREARPPVKH